ncbi:ATP-dependent DNA ligase [Sinorhizobium terangae]|nr:ATP-dependent DNA ligase [Sinorhizobium terangae]
MLLGAYRRRMKRARSFFTHSTSFISTAATCDGYRFASAAGNWSRSSPAVRGNPAFQGGPGGRFFRVACAHGLEGIIAKDREKPYRSGRGGWLKITCRQRDSFVIVGYEPSTVPGAIGRLLLAARKGEGLVRVGGCGTGWSYQESIKLRELLDEIRTDKPAVSLRRKGAVFVRPMLVAEVEYRTWTGDGKLRHPSFKRIRKRADDATVFDVPVTPSRW